MGTRVWGALAGTAAVLGPATVALAAKEIAAAPPNRYTASVVTIDQGEEVVFRNGDVASHDVTARQAGPDRKPLFASKLIDGGDTAPVEGTEYLTSGDYAFFCSVHPGMEATLRVSSAGTPVPRPAEPSQPPPAAPEVSVALLSSAKAIRKDRRMRLRLTSSAAAELTLTVRVGDRRAYRGTRSFPAGTTTFRVGVARSAAKLARTGRTVRIAFSGAATGERSARLR